MLITPRSLSNVGSPVRGFKTLSVVDSYRIWPLDFYPNKTQAFVSNENTSGTIQNRGSHQHSLVFREWDEMSLCSVGCHRNVSLFLFSVSAAQRRSGGQSVLWTHASHTNTLFFINISVPQRSSVEFHLNLSLHHWAVLYDITQNVFYIFRTSSSSVGLWRIICSSSWFHGGPLGLQVAVQRQQQKKKKKKITSWWRCKQRWILNVHKNTSCMFYEDGNAFNTFVLTSTIHAMSSGE